MQIYTIGINTATANAPELAKIALDPKQYLMEDSAFKTYVDQFTGEQKTAVLPNAGDVPTKFENKDKWNFTAEDLKYNDGYYDVIGQGSDIDWKSVFDLVLAQVTSNTAKVPTLVDKTDVHGDSSGYLDYMDPLENTWKSKTSRL